MDKYRVHFVSTGDLLRQHIAEKSTIGKEAEAVVAQGGTSRYAIDYSKL
jgi:adenylate kinase family enzyme